jgi:hypothetical protein
MMEVSAELFVFAAVVTSFFVSAAFCAWLGDFWPVFRLPKGFWKSDRNTWGKW